MQLSAQLKVIAGKGRVGSPRKAPPARWVARTVSCVTLAGHDRVDRTSAVETALPSRLFSIPT
jgi:hypothetical protein